MPAASERTIAVRGLAGLQRAFRTSGKEFEKELRHDLADIAEPVRVDAEGRAVDEIRNIHTGDPWSEMRVGVTRTLVYVAPKQRSRNARRNPALRRPNLAGLLMDRAMEPALNSNADKVGEDFDRLLVRLEHHWERA